MTSALNRTVRSRRNREFKEEYEKVFYVLLEEFGLSYGNVVDKHSKTLTKLRDLLNSEVSKLDDYVSVFKESIRPLLNVNSYYLEMIIKHTIFCRRIVSNAQEVQMHAVALDVIAFSKEYDQQRNKLPDYQVEMIIGWWFALYIHVLSIIQATSTNREEVKFAQIAADYLAQSSAVAILLVSGLHLYDKSLLRTLGLTEKERERDERDTRYNSVPSTPDDSAIRDKSRKLTQATRKRLRAAHKYLKLHTEKRGTVLPDTNSGIDDPEALRQTLSVAYKKACWTSVVKLQRAYPPLATVITCLVKCVPPHTCRQLLGIDRLADARFADRSVIAMDPSKLHNSATTIEDLSLADAETSNDSKLIVVSGDSFSSRFYVICFNFTLVFVVSREVRLCFPQYSFLLISQRYSNNVTITVAVQGVPNRTIYRVAKREVATRQRRWSHPRRLKNIRSSSGIFSFIFLFKYLKLTATKTGYRVVVVSSSAG